MGLREGSSITRPDGNSRTVFRTSGMGHCPSHQVATEMSIFPRLPRTASGCRWTARVDVVGFLVTPGGFEPPTCRLGGGRSILLSYGAGGVLLGYRSSPVNLDRSAPACPEGFWFNASCAPFHRPDLFKIQPFGLGRRNVSDGSRPARGRVPVHPAHRLPLNRLHHFRRPDGSVPGGGGGTGVPPASSWLVSLVYRAAIIVAVSVSMHMAVSFSTGM